MRSNPVRLFTGAAVAAVLAAGAVTAGALQLGSAGATEPTNIARADFVAVTDFSDDRRLAGFAENVFFGRVTGDGSTTEGDPLPETNFPVQVIETLKGSAGSGSVVVVQQRGQVRGRDDEQVLLEGDQALQPGQTYLFATRSDPHGRRFLVPRFGDLRVRSAAQQNELRARFTEAIQSQIALR
jgi:hypothetical protein